jgi:hypothetical protein
MRRVDRGRRTPFLKIRQIFLRVGGNSFVEPKIRYLFLSAGTISPDRVSSKEYCIEDFDERILGSSVL